LPFLSDTHCHLNLRDFDNDLDEVINRALTRGVYRFLIPGIDLQSSQKSITLCEKYPDTFFAAVGIHPNHSSHFIESDLEFLELLISHPKVVAIGEIGLDFYREKASVEDQVSVFQKMLSFANKSEKPICIHNRSAENKIIEILDSWYSELKQVQSRLVTHPGVFHSFDGSRIISEWALTHNFYLGISGPVTYSKSQDLQKEIQKIDISHLIIETDAPYLTPHPNRGIRNEPCYVRLVAEKISEIKQLDINEVILETSNNARNLFGWADN
jgi:TatD DNase family protein